MTPTVSFNSLRYTRAHCPEQWYSKNPKTTSTSHSESAELSWHARVNGAKRRSRRDTIGQALGLSPQKTASYFCYFGFSYKARSLVKLDLAHPISSRSRPASRVCSYATSSNMSGDLVLVSGASGYLGSWICKKLQEQGFRVRGTVRSLNNKKKVDYLYNLCSDPKYPIELVEADLMKPDSWPAAVKDCKYVMHTASPFYMGKPKHPDDLIKPAVEGSLTVLRAASEAGTVERVVLTSSYAAVVGEIVGRKLILKGLTLR
ncbi:hypothetical protein RRG08_067375 [Elysia crispata]|uniref:NAD-dependent epimerase/dehydratase domain-containing protein n=1 Tax=Elysia crispata TaxID=231223 RepID=A0AAE1CUI0_9GAST|nr:hypothetical protein RRG08_067375 [Elysia crispata]